ncbi:MAG: glycoside hydrolase family 65 protein [Microscillaceae bacterium]|nr:glycoside hydrolase family 65 protein [Microscillaceae bacterium]
MKEYLLKDEWNIIEEGFIPEYNRISESVFSIGNGYMGQRANFEEKYSGESLRGTYMAGVYYPDKTRVGWWKNGYPEYFAKVLNATNWIGIDIKINNIDLDLAQCEVLEFKRVLNMKEGYLQRSFLAKMPNGHTAKVDSQRFVSMRHKELGLIKYTLTLLTTDASLQIKPYLDADVVNQDSNYEEKFWIEVEKSMHEGEAFVTAKTKKTDFHLCTGMKFQVFHNNKEIDIRTLELDSEEKEKYAALAFNLHVQPNDTLTLYKYAANVTSRDHEIDQLKKICAEALHTAYQKGFEQMIQEQAEAWAAIWEHSDISIQGDVDAQQAIRFNIFQLNQTYTGEDERLNIGPKGFTGEKYGGSTYWDTEAYCLAFYLATAEPQVAKNLLVYRYKHLPKAIENAQKLGFKNGAALYPMVTINGEECHNEWEITFEEIHRNGAIARAIFDYIRYTGDQEYLVDYGLEVLIGISRFWSQRVHFSQARQKYVMHGVTGPNEYENNINNNWYTNTMAQWTLRYTTEAINWVKNQAPQKYAEILEKTHFKESAETARWQEIANNLHFPYSEELGVFLQQDDYLDKEQLTVDQLDPKERPINQNWSWDRILRSCFIKQADTLQGIYVFEDRFDLETIRRNFDFYEPRTVHESSLSPCVHAILAAKLGRKEKAYEMYLRTSRLDLDDYNNDTEDGCHITSMAGTWMAIVQGFGGMRIKNDLLSFEPFIPTQWDAYAFKILFRGHLLNIQILKDKIVIGNQSPKTITVLIHGEENQVEGNSQIEVALS